jgi:oligoendopeptidase F
VAAVRDGYKQVERFYKIQAKLLRVSKLEHYDRYAPLPGSREQKIPYERAVKTVGDAYAGFDQQFADIFNYLAGHGAVDVHATGGKRGGAFCMGMPRGHAPYILLNYLGSGRDVETLAHEMGHGIQDVLVQNLPYLVAQPPLVLAETSSIFGEMVVFDAALAAAKSNHEKIAMLSGKISQFIATVFRQTAMFQFERLVHSHVAREGQVDAASLSAYWLKTQREMFGKSMNLDDTYGDWWSYVSHFYHTPFYVYAYSFGNLLVFSLYEKYRQGMPGFVEKYKQLLALGGSKMPQEAVAPFGFDLEDPAFWAAGIALFKGYVDQLESMV